MRRRTSRWGTRRNGHQPVRHGVPSAVDRDLLLRHGDRDQALKRGVGQHGDEATRHAQGVTVLPSDVLHVVADDHVHAVCEDLNVHDVDAPRHFRKVCDA